MVPNGQADAVVVSYDGRRARRDRNNEAVIRACWDLFVEGDLHPTAQQVADRSGVSLRSVFRHFQNLDALVRCAVDWFLEHHVDLFVFAEPAEGASLDERIDALIDYRIRLYREVGLKIRAAVSRGVTDPEIAVKVAAHRTYVEGVVRSLFEPELARLTEDERQLVVAAVHMVVQFEGWEMLALRHGLREEQIVCLYRAGLRLALAQR